MIKRFHVLYVGQIALDKVGLDGTPANDRRYPRDGRYLEQVGTYDPSATVDGLKLNREKIATWIKDGARPSQTVAELIKRAQDAS